MGIIAGIYSKTDRLNLKNLLESMMQCQAHRDRTNPSVFLKSRLAFGMANKHDTVFCNQIEKDSNPSEAINKKSNGIYAFVDGIVLDVPRLRKFFEDDGGRVPVPSGSSVIEAAYEKWGIDFMTHLEGEFACAVWDDNLQTLILARDPYGHKPLHYCNDDPEQFVFSSEIKGVLTAGIKREIDLVSLSDYLSLNCIPFPGTVFKGVYQVPPGGLLILRNNEIQIQPYWSPVISEDTSISFNDAVDLVSEKLESAVKKRIVGDKTYCFLSGGIDSSAILSFASDMAGKKVHAITVGFEEAEKSELEDAERMAKHVGAEHHQVIATPDSFFKMLDTLVFHHDQPFSDTSAYPTYYAGKLGGSFTDVILTGDGPDQSMGGSGHHVFAIESNLFFPRKKFAQFFCSVGAKMFSLLYNDPTPTYVSKIGRKLYRDSLSPVRAAYDLRSYFPYFVKKYMCSDSLWEVHKAHDPFRHPDNWFEKVRNLDPINQYLHADMEFYVPDDLMIKVDRMCMAHGLETLSPFQDLELAKIVNRLPGSFKIKNTLDDGVITKYILKKCCEKRFPPDTLSKKKQGFGIPLEKWLKKDNGGLLKEILFDERTLKRGFFKKESILNMLKNFFSNRDDYYYPSPNMIVSLLTFELWCRRYMD